MAPNGAEEVGRRIFGLLERSGVQYENKMRKLPQDDAGEIALETARRAMQKEIGSSIDCTSPQSSADVAAAQLLGVRHVESFRQRCINEGLPENDAVDPRKRTAFEWNLRCGSPRALEAIASTAGYDVLVLADDCKTSSSVSRLKHLLSLQHLNGWKQSTLCSPFEPSQTNTWSAGH